MAFLKYQAGMPARMGTVSERLVPANPWQALQAKAFE
jgi:hypothetical protein